MAFVTCQKGIPRLTQEFKLFLTRCIAVKAASAPAQEEVVDVIYEQILCSTKSLNQRLQCIMRKALFLDSKQSRNIVALANLRARVGTQKNHSACLSVCSRQDNSSIGCSSGRVRRDVKAGRVCTFVQQLGKGEPLQESKRSRV